MRILVDECLSPLLVEMARDAGYESMRIDHLGLGGMPDHTIMKTVLDGHWTFVTSNSGDFRPDPESGSSKPCYFGVESHAGLICLNLPDMPADMANRDGRTAQANFFATALEHLPAAAGNLDNRIIEIDQDPNDPHPIDGTRLVRIYNFPPVTPE